MSGDATAKKKPSAPKKTADHPPYFDMVKEAIKGLKERNGSSRQAIEKYIKANYKVSEVGPHLKMTLKRNVASGKLLHTKGIGASGSFKLPKEEKKETKPKKKVAAKKQPTAKPKKPAAKKPAAKKPAEKKSAKKSVAKKPAAKKSPKKSAAKKPIARKAVKKSPKKTAKKPAAKNLSVSKKTAKK